MNRKGFSSILILSLLLFSCFSLHAGIVKGKVTDERGSALPYANIYVKNTTYGVAADLNGNYFLELKSGNYTLIFSYIGYQTVEKSITVSDVKPLVLNVALAVSAYATSEVVISPDREDPARKIMQAAREKRPEYFKMIESYTCKTYIKSSLERISKNPQMDSLMKADTVLSEKLKKLQAETGEKKLNLIESISETFYKKPATVREYYLAYHDYTDKEVPMGVNVSAEFSYGPSTIAPDSRYPENDLLLFKDLNSCFFDFYNNLIEYPLICEKPLISPLAYNAGLNYRFRLAGSFYSDDNRLIYQIEVIPLFKTEPLFSGIVFIEDSTFALISVDLTINRAAMKNVREYRIIQNYEKIIDSFYLPVRREMIYTISEGSSYILGNTRITHTDYVINQPFARKFKPNEMKIFAVDAFDKDSSFWNAKRPVTLKDEELSYISRSDSIMRYYSSDEYLDKKDSAYNIFRWWSPLFGFGRSNHYKGYQIFIEGIVSQINPFGIGGYRHRLPVYYNQDFKNGYTLETESYIDYGFRNQDIRGKLGAGLTYLPLRFGRTFLRAGDYYDWINNYASFAQIFSRSNYVRTQKAAVFQRLEIINGLFAELSFTFSKQTPILNMKQDKWSDTIFGEINKPVDFIPYIKSEIRLDMLYRFGQKYYIKNNRKVIIGDDYPMLQLVWRKGLPGLFGSEVNFGYFEITGKQYIQFAHRGTLRWEATAGSFYNKKNLRLLEYKYFRGSDAGFFSDPLNSFQLLGPTLLTPNSFFQAAFIHHFEGSLTNRIPLVNWLKIDIAGGAGTLLIPEDNFTHFEMFGGIERIFRIKDLFFRLGLYAVTSDNNLSKADYTFKIGLDFYNPFTKKWSY